MGKKSIFSIVLFCLQCSLSYSQVFIGLQAGLSSNYLNTNISNRPSTIIESKPGYSVNIPIQYTINSWLTIQATPNITQKNYSINRTDSLLGIYSKYNNTYIQLPFFVHLAKGKKLKVFINAGVYIGYWLSGEIKGRIPNVFTATNNGASQQNETFQLTAFNIKYNFNHQIDNRMEEGWIAGSGLQYKLSNKCTLFAECSYYQALTDQQKKYSIHQIPQYDQTFVFSIGSLYSLKRDHHAR